MNLSKPTPPVSAMTEKEFISVLCAAPTPEALSPDQRAIWEIYEKSKLIALRKNCDYASSFAETPALAPHIPPADSILVRMSDKVKRINSLMKTRATGALVKDESIEDTINDLGCYCFLYLVAKAREKETHGSNQ